MTQLSLSIPQSGQPNTTEDPKVASDLTAIQNVINGNLDAGNLASSVTSLFFPAAWTTYTPVWSVITGSTSVGNGSIAGRYIKVGKACWFNVWFSMGSTTTASSNSPLSFSIPFQSVGGIEQNVLAKLYGAANGGFNWCGFGLIRSGDTIVSPFFPVSSTRVNLAAWQNGNTAAAVPWDGTSGSIQNGSVISVSGVYATV